MKVCIILASALACIQSVSAFSTDYFFKICHNIVSEIDLSNECVANMETPDLSECLCTSEEYVSLIYQCINEASTVSKASGSLKQSWNAMNDFCRNATRLKYNIPLPLASDLQTDVHFEDSLFASGVIDAGRSYHNNIYTANAYGLATICFVFGILLIQIALNILNTVRPRLYQNVCRTKPGRWLRRKIATPATFGLHQASPYKLFKIWDLSFPDRMHSILIFCYTALCMVLLFVNHDIVVSPYLNTTRLEALTKFVGYRSGFLAMYKLPLLILFAGRNNFLIWLTGWNYEIFNNWHRWLGRLFLLDIAVHGICYTAWGQWAGVLLEKWSSFPPWIAAQTATIATGILCILSFKSVRSRAYELFGIIHIFLALVVLIGTFIHAHYWNLALEPFYVAVGCWVVDRLLSLSRIVVSGPIDSKMILTRHGEILEISLRTRRLWACVGGSYVYVYALDSFKNCTGHPFTLVPSLSTDDKFAVKLFVRAREGFTRRLLQSATANEEGESNGSKQLTIPCMLNGPYGTGMRADAYDEIVLFVGGIGITGALAYLMNAVNTSTKIYSLYWSAQNPQVFGVFHQYLERLTKSSKVNIQLFLTNHDMSDSDGEYINILESELKESKEADREDSEGENQVSESESSQYFIKPGRPPMSDLVGGHIRETRGPICFYVCGPARMSDRVRREVALNMDKTSQYVQFVADCFYV